ncbi:hypothetical protein LMF57_12320 [Stenotrophomonas sp. SI-NJAU-1]|jgi:hypothetical protein|uniref:hypothetical protein n=1 Tax=Stenotrophomonas TaxID=40323 RepID=UPI001AA1883B|nr:MULTISPECIES: hypothetical protein [Stenotrophomonas]MBO1749013.1 hypothetical protein [Stenotrophomonas indicatrix]UEX16802.1 hypothetical protein LMF57_12320 [Stenotrophomonas sp. SI-NJAU-1]
MNKVVNRLKGEAAALGANGILLQGMDNQYIGSVNSGYATANTYGNSAYATGVGYSAAQFSKVGRAIAIFVPANVAASPTPLPAHELQAPSPPAVTPVPPRPAAATRPDASPGQPASDSSWRKWGKNGE